MKRSALLLAVLLCSLCLNAREYISFLGKTLVLEDSLGAAVANRRSDDYTRSHTSFDRAIRLGRETGATEQDYLDLAAKSMRNWDPAEREALRKSAASLAEKASSLALRLPVPDTVYICKSSCREEFGAEGYTRANRIMLHATLEELGPGLLAHELWHVLSRLAPSSRDKAYAGFGFRPCNRIDYKPAFKGQVISNPDCPFIEHVVTIAKDGKKVDVAIVLYSRSPFVKGGGLMEYVAVGLLALEGDDAHKKVIMREGNPVVYEFSECPDFFRQTGKNTQYMLHVEELTAEHFSALMTGRAQRQQEFVDRLAASLR